MNSTLANYGYKFNNLVFNNLLYNFKGYENASLSG